jgi:TRAP-type C4-dicarboxylate transport system permease small subunit
MIKKLDQFFNVFGKIEMWLSSFFLLLITGLILLQIFCRYILGSPLIWPEELAIIFTLWMSFIGASYVHKKNRHLTLNFIVDRMPKTLAMIIDLVTHLMVIYFCYIIIKGGLRILPIQARNLSPALHIPSSFYTIPLLVAGACMILYSAYYILRILRQKPLSKEKS